MAGVSRRGDSAANPGSDLRFHRSAAIFLVWEKRPVYAADAGNCGPVHRLASGNVRTKLAPPLVSSSLKSPLICRANRRERANPSPTPGAELAASRADLENGRKSFRDSA